jgi:endonuclease/exonuclease/phosphatase family metal-dependent hydrolase
MIPTKKANNLILGTWNVRLFDKAAHKWRTDKGDSPIRDLSDVACIAEIVRHFDVVAIQEVRGGADAFRAMMQRLGEGWAYLVTDVVAGDAGNLERLAFVYDSTRVNPSGLACELVVAAEKKGIAESVLQNQFARTPYAVSFLRGCTQFTLVTLHVKYGESEVDRIPELKRIADWMADWARKGDAWGTNLLVAGDFNIDYDKDPAYQALTSTGLRPPAQLNFVPRTIFDDPDPDAPPDHRHFYDQIAWFAQADHGKPLMEMTLSNAGMINFDLDIIPADTVTQLSYRISDHFPLWCEFAVTP